jgi:hypothetical protein
MGFAMTRTGMTSDAAFAARRPACALLPLLLIGP